MTQIDLALHCFDWFCMPLSHKEKVIADLKQAVMNERPNSIIVRYERRDCYA